MIELLVGSEINNITSLYQFELYFQSQSMSQKIQFLYSNSQISDILAEAFAKICHQKPKFPVNYLARYLKNHTNKNRQKMSLVDNLHHNAQISQKLLDCQQQLKHHLQHQLQQSKLQSKNKQSFIQKISSTERHQLILNQFCEQLANRLNLSAVYIGELQYQTKKVNLLNEDAQDAHLELEKQKVVKFKYASKNQRGIVLGQLLPLNSVVGKLISQTDQPIEQENAQNQSEKPKHIQGEIYFSSLVGNQSIKFFTFPKLGAYFASALPLKSYLKQKFFDQNTLKISNYRKILHDFQKEIQQKQNKFREIYDQKANSGAEQKELEDMEKEFERQKNQIPKPVMQEFSFQEKKLVVCADTLGMDRQITDEQKNQLREYILHLKNSWEQQEYRLLQGDIQKQLSQLMGSHEQGHDGQIPNYLQQFNSLIEQEQKEIPSHEQVERVKDNEKLYELQSNTIRFERTKQYMTEDKFLKHWDHLLGLNVIKYAQVMKQFLIFLGYTKEEFCFPNSNILNWIQTRTLLKREVNRIIQFLQIVTPRGSKPQKVPSYVKCRRIAKNIEGLEPVGLVNYNIYMAWILRLLQLYTKIRLQDREARVIKNNTQREIREQKIKQAQQKENQKKQRLQSLKADLQQKGQFETFDQQAWSNQWDEQNPPVEIPQQVEEDIDMDLDDPSESQGQQEKEQ